MGIARRGGLEPMVGDPDDHRPRTTWRLAVDPGTGDRTAELSFLDERCAVGDRIPLHRHDVDEVVVVISGSGTYNLDGETNEVQEGDVVFIPSGTVHGTVNSGDEVLHLHAVFPARKVRMEMLERNPAPGTESQPSMTTVYDFATGEFESLGPTALPDLFHIAEVAAWERAVPSGVYDRSTHGLSLQDVGFIHASFAWQVERVANFVYATNVEPLVLLRIDPAALKSPVRVERPDDASEGFPHIYGPLRLEAVVEVLPLERRDGEYKLPFPPP